ncbi:MAG: CDP-alcohol phosphatidyltransferase family protein [Anaerolineales bacterium]|nr:CDP-alcohol phosphatidyltransferase family protein [Anaerolineales bacterium]
MEQAKEKKNPLTFTDLMRTTFKGVLDPIAAFLNRLGLMPNTMTLLGLAGNAIGAFFLAQGQMTLGGVLILLMGPVDALDGTMARLRGMAGQFGAFVDSVTDRYSELVIFGGLLYYYVRSGDTLAVMGVFAAAAGSVLVSYVRARGQSLGWDTKVGILTRLERYLVLAPTLILNVPLIGVWIIAVFANFTALQRILDIRRRARQDDPS